MSYLKAAFDGHRSNGVKVITRQIIISVKDRQIFQSICYYNAYTFKTEVAV